MNMARARENTGGLEQDTRTMQRESDDLSCSWYDQWYTQEDMWIFMFSRHWFKEQKQLNDKIPTFYNTDCRNIVDAINALKSGASVEQVTQEFRVPIRSLILTVKQIGIPIPELTPANLDEIMQNLSINAA